MREGPGSYFPLVLRLYEDAEVTKIKQEDTWVKVSSNNKEGWIPEHAVDTGKQKKDEESSDDPFGGMDSAFDELDSSTGKKSSTESSVTASRAEVAAAVKGFSDQYRSKRGSGSGGDITDYFDNNVNARDYLAFRRDRLGKWGWIDRQRRFYLNPDYIARITPQAERLGWAIAARLVNEYGLVENAGVRTYLTYVALLVLENSHSYSTPMQIHILDTDKVAGYACPNGFIFVTKGALKIMRSESEFAYFIAHELTHITFQHGYKELLERMPRIKAASAIDELETAVGERESDKISDELSDMADQIYDYVNQNRLEEYEFEADYWGLIYLYRAGYNPHAGVHLLERMRNLGGELESEVGELVWKGTPLQERADRLKDQIERRDFHDTNIDQEYKAAFRSKVERLW